MASNEIENNSNKARPIIPVKNFRLINNRVTYLNNQNNSRSVKPQQCEIVTKISDPESENSDVDAMDQKDGSESDCNSEIEALSKPECISKECLSFIKLVHQSLANLLDFKKELDQEFIDDAENTKTLTNVFRDIGFLKEAYQMILESIKKLESKRFGFYLYEVLLDSVVANVLKIYKPFLSQYSSNAKWIGDFNKGNQSCIDACDRARKKYGIMANISIDNCFYTVFTSLFSLELMFDRYRKCYAEDSEEYKHANEAKNVISNLLSVINTDQDQAEFLLTQQELNLLTGKSKELKNFTRFVHKGNATKFARRDGKPLTRQLVLFTEVLYVTLLPRNIVGTSSVRQELSISSMSVYKVHEDEVTYSNQKWGLTIDAREAVQDFFFESEQDMNAWKDKLESVIKEESKCTGKAKRKTFVNSLGKEAPRWQKDNAAGYCNGYKCLQKFNTTIRRHHCRADGLLYCDSCCSFKVKLDFERTADSRVCELCFNILNGLTNKVMREDSIERLQVVMERKLRFGKKTGWLVVKSLDKDQQVPVPEFRYFCELHPKDVVLKLFEKFEDKSCFVSLMLMMVEVKMKGDAAQHHKSLSSKKFSIEHKEKKEGYIFKAESREECQGWVECIQERISSFENT